MQSSSNSSRSRKRAFDSQSVLYDEYSLDMERVLNLAGDKHPLLVEQLFDPEMLEEIRMWEQIEEVLDYEEDEDEFESAREGAVYFADTPSMKGSIMKIGGTKYDGPTRMRQLFTAGVPEPFTCRLETRCSDWKLYERTIQEYFKDQRVYSNKEFFVLTIIEAARIIDQINGSEVRTVEEQKKWDAAFSLVKYNIEKSRRLWAAKKAKQNSQGVALAVPMLLNVSEVAMQSVPSEVCQTVQPTSTHDVSEQYIAELEMLKTKCEILTRERDEALERCNGFKCDQTEIPIAQPERVSIFVPEILPHICKFLTNVQDLGRLCKTNIVCWEYLASVHAGKHWASAGKLACGEEYWNDSIFDCVVEKEDELFKTVLHMCPWRAIPRKFKVDQLKALHLLDERYTILGMKLDDERSLLEYKDDLGILIDVEDDGYSPIHGRMVIETNSMSEREQDEDDDVFMQDRERKIFIETRKDIIHKVQRNPSEEELEIMRELENDQEFMNALLLYGSGFIDDVQIVNKGVFAAFFYSGQRDRNVLFISMHDKRKILWDANLGGGDSPGVLFSPGEMWFVTDNHQLWYFGPNKDAMYDIDGSFKFGVDGRIPRAFCSTISRNASLALQILEPTGLDLYSIKAPNTNLTLFDVAADPDGNGLCRWKTTQVLTPDAAMLLQQEPRFKTSIFMMMRAIYEVDNQKVRELISNGLKVMPYHKLWDCLERDPKPRLDFEQVCKVLHVHGMDVMHSDGQKYVRAGKWKARHLE